MSYGQSSPAADFAPTLSASIRMNLRGFSSHDEGHRMAVKAVECLHELSRVIDLASLEGLTIAQDYDDALSNLEEIFTPPPLVLIGDDEGDSGGVLATMRCSTNMRSLLRVLACWWQRLECKQQTQSVLFGNDLPGHTGQCTLQGP